MTAADQAVEHLMAHLESLTQMRAEVDHLVHWGETLASVLGRDGRLLAAGNGGSASEAQHLTSELVGRFGAERRPFAAIALHAETSSLTAIANDYGWEEAYARMVEAHGRDGDVLFALSTSGASGNVLAAARAARAAGLRTWALTGASPNPLERACDDAICVAGPVPVVQEAHLIAVHVLCAVVDVAWSRARSEADVRVLPAAGGVR